MQARTVLIGLLIGLVGFMAVRRLMQSAPLPDVPPSGDGARNQYQGGDRPMTAAFDAALETV